MYACVYLVLGQYLQQLQSNGSEIYQQMNSLLYYNSCNQASSLSSRRSRSYLETGRARIVCPIYILIILLLLKNKFRRVIRRVSSLSFLQNQIHKIQFMRMLRIKNFGNEKRGGGGGGSHSNSRNEQYYKISYLHHGRGCNSLEGEKHEYIIDGI